MNNLSFNKMNYLLFNFNKNNWFLNIVKCLYYCCFLLSIKKNRLLSIMFVIMIVITFIILYFEYYFRNNF